MGIQGVMYRLIKGGVKGGVGGGWRRRGGMRPGLGIGMRGRSLYACLCNGPHGD